VILLVLRNEDVHITVCS